MAGNRNVPARQQAGQSNAQRLEEFRTALLERTDDLTRALAGTIDPQAFMEIALTAVATIRESDTRAKVLNCTPDSFTMAVIQAAQTGLRIDGRQSVIVPYGNVATWTPMVKGRIDLILRAPNVAKVVTRAVLDCDEFEYVLGTEEKIVHRPNLNPPADAKLTHAYAIVWKDDGTQVFEVLGRARIDQIRTSFSKAPKSPAWEKSYNEMAQKCALNRVERLVDTDPTVARAMAHAMAAEFEIPVDDVDDRVTARVHDQVAEAREKIEALKLKAGEPAKTAAESDLELRRQLVHKIGEAVAEQGLDREEGAKEARAALGLAGMTDYPQRDDGCPDLNQLNAEELKTILDHIQALGPGFGGEAQDGGQEEAAAAEQDQPAAETDEATPAADPGGEEPAKVDPLICRKVGKGKGDKIHIGDPLRAKPPICVGCRMSIGAAAGASGFSAVADWTVYCPKALEVVDREYAAERVPEPILAALIGRAAAE